MIGPHSIDILAAGATASLASSSQSASSSSSWSDKEESEDEERDIEDDNETAAPTDEATSDDDKKTMLQIRQHALELMLQESKNTNTNKATSRVPSSVSTKSSVTTLNEKFDATFARWDANATSSSILASFHPSDCDSSPTRSLRRSSPAV